MIRGVNKDVNKDINTGINTDIKKINKLIKLAERYLSSKAEERIGDVPSLRLGDHITRPDNLHLESSFAKHHGIVVKINNNVYDCLVAHLYGRIKTDAKVIITTLREFLLGKSTMWVYMTPYNDAEMQSIADAAVYMANNVKIKFNIITNNCEKFCIDSIKMGLKRQFHVDNQVKNLSYLFDYLTMSSEWLNDHLYKVNSDVDKFILDYNNGESMSIYLLDGRPQIRYSV
jgi:hypothetical protein